jgi:hypothetical protein
MAKSYEIGWSQNPGGRGERAAESAVQLRLAGLSVAEASCRAECADRTQGVYAVSVGGWFAVLVRQRGRGNSKVKAHASSHLRRLEAESIHIMREAVAESENPVMLYSIGKDSSVMLRLAQKAFFPAQPPFPLMHIDTLWKFREM